MLSVISETTRIVYGNFSFSGSSGRAAPARPACRAPISRRPGEPMRPVSFDAVGGEVVVQHERSRGTRPASASMICSSWPVPSVATQKACVSPRVNSARAMRARQDADLGDDRADRPGVAAVDAQLPVSRMALRTTSASSSFSSALGGASVIEALGGPARSTTAFLAAPKPDLLPKPASGSPCDRPRRSACGPSASMRDFSAVSRLGGLGQRSRASLAATLGQLDDPLDHRLEGLVAEGRRRRA